MDIENCKTRIEAKEEDLRGILARISELEEKRASLDAQKKEKTEELIHVQADLQASDYGVKKKELDDLETTIQLLAGNSRQWREILNGLRAWEEDEDISSYVSNPTLQSLDDVLDGKYLTAHGYREL